MPRTKTRRGWKKKPRDKKKVRQRKKREKKKIEKGKNRENRKRKSRTVKERCITNLSLCSIADDSIVMPMVHRSQTLKWFVIFNEKRGTKGSIASQNFHRYPLPHKHENKKKKIKCESERKGGNPDIRSHKIRLLNEKVFSPFFQLFSVVGRVGKSEKKPGKVRAKSYQSPVPTSQRPNKARSQFSDRQESCRGFPGINT